MAVSHRSRMIPTSREREEKGSKLAQSLGAFGLEVETAIESRGWSY